MDFSSLIKDIENDQSSFAMESWISDHLTKRSLLDAYPALKTKVVLSSNKKSSLHPRFQESFTIWFQCHRDLPDHLCEWDENTFVQLDTSAFVQWDKPVYLPFLCELPLSNPDLNWNLDYQLNSLEAEVQLWYDKIEKWFSETPETIRTSEVWLQRFNEKVQHIQRSVAGILNRIRELRRALSSRSTLKFDFRLTIRKKICVLFKVLDDEHAIAR